MRKALFIIFLMLVQFKDMQAQCNRNGNDEDLDCHQKGERALLVQNHCLSKIEFENMVTATSKHRSFSASYIKRELKYFLDIFWMNCERYRIKLELEDQASGAYIDFAVQEIPPPRLTGYYHLGLFRGLFEKYSDLNLQKFVFYVGKNTRGRSNFPFKVIYYDAAGTEQTDYYDFSQEDPNKINRSK